MTNQLEDIIKENYEELIKSVDKFWETLDTNTKIAIILAYANATKDPRSFIK